MRRRTELAQMRGGGFPLKTIFKFVKSNAPKLFLRFRHIWRYLNSRNVHNNSCLEHLLRKNNNRHRRHRHKFIKKERKEKKNKKKEN